MDRIHLIFCIILAVTLTFIQDCEPCNGILQIITVGKPGNSLPSFDRPNLKYTKVDYNCMHRSVLKSKTPTFKRFYKDFDLHFQNFLVHTKSNKMSFLNYQINLDHLRESYDIFQKNISILARPCKDHASFKNMMGLLKTLDRITTFLTTIDEQQYSGKFCFDLSRLLNLIDGISALSRESFLECMTDNFDKILNCTAKDFIYYPVYTYRNVKHKHGKIKNLLTL